MIKYIRTINLLILSIFILIFTNYCPNFAQTEVGGYITANSTITDINSSLAINKSADNEFQTSFSASVTIGSRVYQMRASITNKFHNSVTVFKVIIYEQYGNIYAQTSDPSILNGNNIDFNETISILSSPLFAPLISEFDHYYVKWFCNYKDSGFIVSSFVGTDNTIFPSISGINDIPVIVPIGDKLIEEENLLTIVIDASDGDDDSLTYGVIDEPLGSVLSGNVFTWTPSIVQSGVYQTTFTVSDYVSTKSDTITITVLNSNRVPSISSMADTTIYEDISFTRQVCSYDPDGDTLTYSLISFPYGMIINSSSGEIYWIPDFDQSGNYTVTVNVKDGNDGEDTESFSLIVLNVNRAPVITTFMLSNATEGVFYSDTIEVADPDEGETLIFSILDGTEWLNIDSLGILSGTPANDDVGTNIPVSVKVKDSSGLSDTLNTTINVINVNDAPIIITYSPAQDTVIAEGDSVEFSIITQDIDNDTLFYTWFLDETIAQDFVLPSTDSTSTLFLYFPFGSKGAHLVKVTVSDGQLSADNLWGIEVVEMFSELNTVNEIIIPEDTSSISLNFANNSSVAIKFKSGDVENEKLIVTQYTSITNSFPNVPDFNNGLYYFKISLNVEQISADLAFSYSDSLLNEKGIVEDSLAVCVYDSTDWRGFIWHSLPVEIDKENNKIKVIANHFSLWAIVSKNEEILTDLTDEKVFSPREFRLFQNYPNPFNPETHIKYEIPKTSNIEIAIYNILGQKIKTLLNEIQNPGFYEIIWNGTNEQGINVSSGVYLYVIKAKDFIASRKMILLR